MAFKLMDILTIIGALGLFLYGMKVMSLATQKLAGKRLRSTLESLTRKPFLGVLFGLIVTSLIQSSSATTVMVVGFANVGLLSLIESLGVIMGANIGTTLTSWLVAIFGFKLQIDVFLLPLIGLGFFMVFFRRGNLRFFGEFLIGFALLFLGLHYMKTTVPDLQNHPEMFEYFKGLADSGIGNLLLFVGFGTIITIILQSSSATITLTFVLCSNGWINFESAAAIVLGENLGTTATANIAAIVGNIKAKKTAFAHTLFNIFGILWVLPLLYPFLNLINEGVVLFGNASPYSSIASIPIALSFFHTLFNILNTIVVLIFYKYFVSFINYIFPKEDKSKKLQLEYINSGYIGISEFSVLEARKELLKFIQLANSMVCNIPNLLVNKDEDEFCRIKQEIDRNEEIANKFEIEITAFLVKLSSNDVSEKTAQRIRSIRQISSYIEKIGDSSHKLATLIAKKNEENAYFTPKQREQLGEMFHLLTESLNIATKAIAEQNFIPNKSEITEIEEKLNYSRDLITEELFTEDLRKANIKSAYYFNKFTETYEKIGDFTFIINKTLIDLNS